MHLHESVDIHGNTNDYNKVLMLEKALLLTSPLKNYKSCCYAKDSGKSDPSFPEQ